MSADGYTGNGGGGSVASVDDRTGAVTLTDLYDAIGAAAAARIAAEAYAAAADVALLAAAEAFTTAAIGALGSASEHDAADFATPASVAAAIAALALGTASTHAAGDFDAAGAASTAQAYAIQRAHHTGSQLAATISDFAATAAAAAPVQSVAGRFGAVAIAHGDVSGLGGAALLNVGSTTGTVAAGDDSRLSDTRTPTDNTVTSAKIVDGAIVNADINGAAAIALSKLATDPLARANHTGTQVMSTISDAGTAAKLNVGTAAGTVAPGLPAGWGPTQQGFIAWNFDPSLISNSTGQFIGGATPGKGIVALMAIVVPLATTITNIHTYILTAGAAVSNGLVALLDTSGNTLSVSAAVTTAWQSTGLSTVALGTPQAVAAGVYVVAVLVGNGTTTGPEFARGGASGIVGLNNVNLATAASRWATSGSGLTAIPNPITMSAITPTSVNFWVAVS